MLRKPLLPEWRYWPALTLAAFVMLAGAAWSYEPQVKDRASAAQELGNPIKDIFAFFERWSADDYIAAFTALTGLIFFFQLLAMRRENEHFQVTERAYVKMSHRPPGAFLAKINNRWFAIVTLRIKNFGNTPASVTDAYITSEVIPEGQSLSDTPVHREWGERERVSAFLVREDEFNHRAHLGLTQAQYDAVMAGDAELNVFGYVDYRDKFGTRHRGTYARVYDPLIDDRTGYMSDEEFAGRNNLTIVSKPLYNADFERKKGEGVDWSD
jgi:hypothetical protein